MHKKQKTKHLKKKKKTTQIKKKLKSVLLWTALFYRGLLVYVTITIPFYPIACMHYNISACEVM
jgi:hypothetical protein